MSAPRYSEYDYERGKIAFDAYCLAMQCNNAHSFEQASQREKDAWAAVGIAVQYQKVMEGV